MTEETIKKIKVSRTIPTVNLFPIGERYPFNFGSELVGAWVTPPPLSKKGDSLRALLKQGREIVRQNAQQNAEILQEESNKIFMDMLLESLSIQYGTETAREILDKAGDYLTAKDSEQIMYILLGAEVDFIVEEDAVDSNSKKK